MKEENTTIDPIIEERVRKFFSASDVNGTPIGEFILHNGEMLADIAEIQDTLRTILTEVYTSAEQLGHEQGFVKGQKHAFGVDRKAVEQEGYARAMGKAREQISCRHDIDGDVCDCCRANHDRIDDLLPFTPTDNNKES